MISSRLRRSHDDDDESSEENTTPPTTTRRYPDYATFTKTETLQGGQNNNFGGMLTVLSPDGQTLLVGGEMIDFQKKKTPALKIYFIHKDKDNNNGGNATTTTTLVQTIEGHSINSASFSQDGSSFALLDGIQQQIYVYYRVLRMNQTNIHDDDENNCNAKEVSSRIKGVLATYRSVLRPWTELVAMPHHHSVNPNSNLKLLFDRVYDGNNKHPFIECVIRVMALANGRDPER